ncbi:hypothetical protein H2200_002912 [Cladophialophora chaetospira]|uniref:Uncharacterized protein n=1 Tax=Cladophialophora chaetospira TaxID=386627 RepID=A0AA38XGK5_9EURO|nr:hypothetical protein H2200_002912 [Cladophialophora chaetospira]
MALYGETDVPGNVVITGAASGKAVANAFAKAKCSSLALLDLDEHGLSAVRASITEGQKGTASQAYLYTCDISNESSVIDTFRKIQHDLGRIDYAVNCAGVPGPEKPSHECDANDFDRTIAINLRGIFLCAREEIRMMKGQSLDAECYPGIPAVRSQRGAIVNIASGLGVAAMPNTTAYCASKAGVMALTRSDAVDYSSHRIRVNSVLPGATQTPMSHTNDTRRQAIEAVAVDVFTPMKRWGKAEEIADVCLFLCSNKASFVQGVAVPVDGGYLAM